MGTCDMGCQPDWHKDGCGIYDKEPEILDENFRLTPIGQLEKIREFLAAMERTTVVYVRKAREEGKDWDEIGAALGIGGGQAYVQYAHLINDSCWNCRKCMSRVSAWPYSMGMILCETCGNKRCPHATDHELACTGSNEPGQKGSAYE